MSAELDKITHLSRQYSRKLKKLTEPLLKKFGITYFARQSVNHQGHWEILGNLPDWLEYSASKQFYEVDPSLLHPDHYKPGLIVNSSQTAPTFLKEMARTALELYDIENTLCILEKNKVGCEWYFFSASAKNTGIINTYIANIHSIFKYIKYFKQEAQSLLNQNLEFSLELSQLKNEPFHSNRNVLELTPTEILRTDTIKWQGKNISGRERDCLKSLLRGKTVKETAKLLNISNRTVEEYLNRLKQKVGCQYNRELIGLFQGDMTF